MTRDPTKSLQRSLAHLRPPPVRGGKFAMPIPSHFAPKARFVQVKDRIPFWNIAPSDKVIMVRGSKDLKGKEATVQKVDREGNRIYLTESDFSVKKRMPSEYPGQALEPGGSSDQPIYAPRAYHIANFRLRVHVQGKTYTATRVKRSAVTWDRAQKRFSWHRYGLVTELATETTKGWVKIAWPKEEVPTSSPGPLDAESGSTDSPWKPSLASLSLDPSSSTPPAEELKISALDLQGGYHSRAQRTKRFNEKKHEEKVHGIKERGAELKQRRKNVEEWVEDLD